MRNKNNETKGTSTWISFSHTYNAELQSPLLYLVLFVKFSGHLDCWTKVWMVLVFLPQLHFKKSLLNHFYQLEAIRRGRTEISSTANNVFALIWILLLHSLSCWSGIIWLAVTLMQISTLQVCPRPPQFSKFSWLSVAGGGGDGYNGLH